MSLFFTSLNSGSNGNCYYVGTQQDAVLVDVGISCRETEKRMKQLGLSMRTVKAIFISHEHTDHTRGVSTLANKYSLPVYITAKTAGNNGPYMIRHLSHPFVADEPVQVGELTVVPFTKKHDAVDPHSFIVQYQHFTVGVLTDIGKVCKEVSRYFAQCHAVFLESNYDEQMLEQGPYPIHLKNRIRNGQGHLSNVQALELFLKHRSPALSHVLLSHLSKENNEPELARQLFAGHAQNCKIVVAGRHEATPVFQLDKNAGAASIIKKKAPKPVQLDLFS